MGGGKAAVSAAATRVVAVRATGWVPRATRSTRYLCVLHVVTRWTGQLQLQHRRAWRRHTRPALKSRAENNSHNSPCVRYTSSRVGQARSSCCIDELGAVTHDLRSRSPAAATSSCVLPCRSRQGTNSGDRTEPDTRTAAAATVVVQAACRAPSPRGGAHTEQRQPHGETRSQLEQHSQRARQPGDCARPPGAANKLLPHCPTSPPPRCCMAPVVLGRRERKRCGTAAR